MLEQYLHTHDHQFGFKKQHSTDMCIFTVKSVIKYYTKQKSSVYTCFLDAAKAFDRVSHWTLFSKLINRNIRFLSSKFRYIHTCTDTGSHSSSQKNRRTPRVHPVYICMLRITVFFYIFKQVVPNVQMCHQISPIRTNHRHCQLELISGATKIIFPQTGRTPT